MTSAPGGGKSDVATFSLRLNRILKSGKLQKVPSRPYSKIGANGFTRDVS